MNKISSSIKRKKKVTKKRQPSYLQPSRGIKDNYKRTRRKRSN